MNSFQRFPTWSQVRTQALERLEERRADGVAGGGMKHRPAAVPDSRQDERESFNRGTQGLVHPRLPLKQDVFSAGPSVSPADPSDVEMDALYFEIEAIYDRMRQQPSGQGGASMDDLLSQLEPLEERLAGRIEHNYRRNLPLKKGEADALFQQIDDLLERDAAPSSAT